MKFNEDILFSFWEIKAEQWLKKEKQITIFLNDLLKTMKIDYELSRNQENIVYEITGKPKDFFSLENHIEKIIKV